MFELKKLSKLTPNHVNFYMCTS